MERRRNPLAIGTAARGRRPYSKFSDACKGHRTSGIAPIADLAGRRVIGLLGCGFRAVESTPITLGCHSAWCVRLPGSGLIAHGLSELRDARHVRIILTTTIIT